MEQVTTDCDHGLSALDFFLIFQILQILEIYFLEKLFGEVAP